MSVESVRSRTCKSPIWLLEVRSAAHPARRRSRRRSTVVPGNGRRFPSPGHGAWPLRPGRGCGAVTGRRTPPRRRAFRPLRARRARCGGGPWRTRPARRGPRGTTTKLPPCCDRELTRIPLVIANEQGSAQHGSGGRPGAVAPHPQRRTAWRWHPCRDVLVRLAQPCGRRLRPTGSFDATFGAAWAPRSEI